MADDGIDAGYEEIIASFTFKTYESEDRSFCVFKYRNQDTRKEFTAVGAMLPDQKNQEPAVINQHKLLLRE